MQSVEFAKELRCHALEMVHRGRSSHIGSVLSIADILAVLYNRILKVRPDWHDWPDRDRFILSKGHAGAGVYAALALAGFLEKSTLTEHYSNGSIFQVMCHIRAFLEWTFQQGHLAMDYLLPPAWPLVRSAEIWTSAFFACSLTVR